MDEPQAEMSFLDHLEELRRRFIASLVAVAVCAIPCGLWWRRILDVILIYPLRMSNPRPRIIFTSPAEAVVVSVKVALACGCIVAAPYIFYQIWAFVRPGLYKDEKRVIVPVALVSTLCFLAGVVVSYIFLPFMMRFLAGFGAGTLEPMFKIDDYLGFLIRIVLAFGIVFEMPVVVFMLVRMRVIAPRFLVDKIRWVVVAIFIVAAVLTPPDIISQIFLALPLLLLYGVSVGVAYMAGGKK